VGVVTLDAIIAAVGEPYFRDDSVVIYHADCRDILPKMPQVDLVLTDPPYGIGYRHGARRNGVKLGMDGESIVGDAKPFDPSHLLGQQRLILWGANHYADRLPAARGWLVWDKRDGVLPDDQSDCEFAWTSFLTTARLWSRLWRGNVRTGREQAEARLHVNQKPVALMAWCLRLDGGMGAVLDPYMGAGSTLLAARELGRYAIGIEIEEEYCEIAAKRMAQGVLL